MTIGLILTRRSLPSTICLVGKLPVSTQQILISRPQNNEARLTPVIYGVDDEYNPQRHQRKFQTDSQTKYHEPHNHILSKNTLVSSRAHSVLGIAVPYSRYFDYITQPEGSSYVRVKHNIVFEQPRIFLVRWSYFRGSYLAHTLQTIGK